MGRFGSSRRRPGPPVFVMGRINLGLRESDGLERSLRDLSSPSLILVGHFSRFRPFGSPRPLHTHVFGPSGRTGRASAKIPPSAPHNVPLPQLFASTGRPAPTSSRGPKPRSKAKKVPPRPAPPRWPRPTFSTFFSTKTTGGDPRTSPQNLAGLRRRQGTFHKNTKGNP